MARPGSPRGTVTASITAVSYRKLMPLSIVKHRSRGYKKEYSPLANSSGPFYPKYVLVNKDNIAPSTVKKL